MAIITPSLLTSLFTGYKAIFETAKAKAPSDWNRVATRVGSSSEFNTYGWLGQFPKLQEWVGERVVKSMAAHDYSIKNKKYESTVGVPRTAIEDDTLGIYNPIFQEMGYAAGTHPDEIIFSLLKAGNATLCYDGQYFFDTDHPVYPNVDGTGDATTVSNNLGTADSTNAAWYLLDISRPLKPLIFQERTAPELTHINDIKSESVFMRDELLYGIRYRCEGGFGFWQQAIRSVEKLDATGFEKARSTLQGFTADGGRPLGLGRGGKAGLLLVVPPSLESAAMDVVSVDKLANGQSNKWYNAATILNSPWVLEDVKVAETP